MAQKNEISNYRLRDQKLTQKIIDLVQKHSRVQKKALSSIRFKYKEHVGPKGPIFEIVGFTREWKHPKLKANIQNEGRKPRRQK